MEKIKIMKIQLDDNYSIEVTKDSYNLCKKSFIKNENKYVDIAQTYHSDLSNCIRTYVRYKMAEETDIEIDIMEFIKKYREIYNEITKLCKIVDKA